MMIVEVVDAHGGFQLVTRSIRPKHRTQLLWMASWLAIAFSSVLIDNVPLVAAGIQMYSFPTNDPFWMLLAFCAGTGGSCLIIGSAAGVAVMGLEQIEFGWYLRRVAPLALFGYAAGLAVFFAQHSSC